MPAQAISDLDSTDPPIRVLIIANDPLARAALATMLENRDEIALVGQITGGEDVFDHLDMYRPDVLVWDLGWDADEAPPELAESEIPVLALLPHEELAGEVWSAGAAALLLRDAGGRRLVTAIQAVVRQLRVLDPTLAATIGDHTLVKEAPLAEELTPREREVLQLLAEGSSNRAIAQALNISEHTVKFHVNAIMSKLDAQSRTEAVVRATRLGLILL